MARIQPGTGNILLEGIIEPVSNTDAANKEYVDSREHGTSNLADRSVTQVKLNEDVTATQLGLDLYTGGSNPGLGLSASFIDSASVLAINMSYLISTTKTDFESTFVDGRMFFSTHAHEASPTLDELFGSGNTRSFVPTDWSDVRSIVLTPNDASNPSRSVSGSALFNAIGAGVIVEVRDLTDARIGIWSITGRTRIGGVSQAGNPIVLQVENTIRDSGDADAYKNDIYVGLRKSTPGVSGQPNNTAGSSYRVIVHGINRASDGRYLLNGSTNFEKLQVFNGFIDPRIAANVTQYEGSAYRLTRDANNHLTGELVDAPVLDLPQVLLGNLSTFTGINVTATYTSTIGTNTSSASGQWSTNTPGGLAKPSTTTITWASLRTGTHGSGLVLNVGSAQTAGRIDDYFSQPAQTQIIKEVLLRQANGHYGIYRADPDAAPANIVILGTSGPSNGGTSGIAFDLSDFTLVESDGVLTLANSITFYFSLTDAADPQPATFLDFDINTVYRGNGTYGPITADAITNNSVPLSKLVQVAGHTILANTHDDDGDLTVIHPGPEFDFVSDTASPQYTSLRLSRAIYPLAAAPSSAYSNVISVSGTSQGGNEDTLSTDGAYAYRTQTGGITSVPSAWTGFVGSTSTRIYFGLGTSFNGDQLIGWLNLTSEPTGDRIVSAYADADNWAVFQVLDSNQWGRNTSGTNTINVYTTADTNGSALYLVASAGAPAASMSWFIGYNESTNTAQSIINEPSTAALLNYEAQVDKDGNALWGEKRLYGAAVDGAVPRTGTVRLPNWDVIHASTTAKTIPLVYDTTGNNLQDGTRSWQTDYNGTVQTTRPSTWLGVFTQVGNTNSNLVDQVVVEDNNTEITSAARTALQANTTENQTGNGARVFVYSDKDNWAWVQLSNTSSVFQDETFGGNTFLRMVTNRTNNQSTPASVISSKGAPGNIVTFVFPRNTSGGLIDPTRSGSDDDVLTVNGWEIKEEYNHTDPVQIFALWKEGIVITNGITYNSSNLPVLVRKQIHIGDSILEMTGVIAYNTDNLPITTTLYSGDFSTVASVLASHVIATKTVTYDAANLPSGTTVT